MRSGMSASDALEALVGQDKGQALRQVAFIDASGDVAAHTGDNCIAEASHRTGEGYSVQANMMLGTGVVDAMADAYESATGPLADRLVAALHAAQSAGGDIRGRQSAAVSVVHLENTGRPWTGADHVVDLRVEDHKTPVAELSRLLTLQGAYDAMSQGDNAMVEGDFPAAVAAYSRAHKLAPEHIEIRYWYGVRLVQTGDVEAATPHLQAVFAAEPHWAELTARLVPTGMLDAEHAQVIVGLAAPQKGKKKKGR